jgi:predicted NUDIX family NTP pyrophosphohydrolase
MGKRSAGILLFRKFNDETQFLLAHPGGPFWAKKDIGAWSIPKGLCDPDEDPLAAAKRELEEETGIVAIGEPAPLGAFIQPSGKTVIAFALEQDFDPANLRSNCCSVEWPPKSGEEIEIPEVDRVGWFSVEKALRKITKGQAPIVVALAERMGIELPNTTQRHG